MIKSLTFVLIFIFTWPLQAEERKTVCVNMIVKNEKNTIRRCLGSLKRIIDYWVIVDTGSTDGTQEIIREFMKDIPGELHERPWKNFAHNRNEALDFAKGKADYVLVIDADEHLIFGENFKMSKLTKDYYDITSRNFGTTYPRMQLVNNHLNWRWEGVLHECIACQEAHTHDILANVINQISWDGVRSQDPMKYHNDALVFEEALKEEPTNRRYVFYLAQSYRDSDNHEAALKSYQKRVLMGGSHEEIFWSLNELAKLQDQLGMSFEEVAQSYLAAYQSDSNRAEPLFYLARKYKLANNALFATFLLNTARVISPPKDYLFLERWIYDYGILMELADCTFMTDKYDESLALCNQIINHPATPTDVKEEYEKSLGRVQWRVEHPLEFEGAFQSYKSRTLDLVAKFLPENPVIIQGGAHYGRETLSFAQMWPKGRIISFEPNPRAYQQAIELTDGLENIDLYEKALSNYKGKATLFVSHGPNGDDPQKFERDSSLLEPTQYSAHNYIGPKVQVPCIALDDWCEDHVISHVDMIWLDLEGMEIQVLETSSKAIETASVVFCKTNFLELRKGMSQYWPLREFMDKVGFTLLSHWYELGFQGDAIFIKKELYKTAFNNTH